MRSLKEIQSDIDFRTARIRKDSKEIAILERCKLHRTLKITEIDCANCEMETGRVD